MAQKKMHWPMLGAFSTNFKHGQIPHLSAGFLQNNLTCIQLGGELLDGVLDVPNKAMTLRQRLAADDITIVALAGYRNLIAPDPALRFENMLHLKRCLRIAPELGIPVVATETGTLNTDNDWGWSPDNRDQPAIDALFAAMDELVPAAERYGAAIALEAHVNHVAFSPDQLDALLTTYDSPNVRIVLDPYNLITRELIANDGGAGIEPFVLGFMDKFKDRFMIAHIKDVSAAGAEVDTPEFGAGVFPQPFYLRWLKDNRPDLPLILDNLPWERVGNAAKRLRTLADGLK